MKVEAVQAEVISVLQGMVQDWDLEEEIGGGTRIVADLEFESIDIIQLVVALEQKFARRDLHFDRLLMVDGRYVDDLSVAQISDFLADALN